MPSLLDRGHMNSDAGRQAKSENRNVTRAAGVVGAATLLSRIFGYIRDMVLASFFGAGMAADAFIAAFRIPTYCAGCSVRGR